MKLKDIITVMESFAPLDYQEVYDNSGLLVGDRNAEVNSALLTIDVTEAVIDEAIETGADLIIAHHPLIFTGMKRLTGSNYIERSTIKAIRNNISIYAAHTNFDNVKDGVNGVICKKLGLVNCKVLLPAKGKLKKLVTFIPVAHAGHVRNAVFSAGAGVIGEYDQCSFNLEGTGTFRGSENTNPFAGEKGKLSLESETRFETIFPAVLQSRVIKALIEAHPYEEVAFDIYPLDNVYEKAGSGMIGETPEPVPGIEFLTTVKKIFGAGIVRHTALVKNEISRVAVCGGSGSSLIDRAIVAGADIFITGEIKYHEFFNADNKIILADIGHFESEQFTKDIFYELLMKNFPNF
ncbi:MAG: Nif3-like dinuclear metal center hexameric protein, partial [Bacteroidales bacterium]|nr:Nif3-like dinuclear metal center hexameric protein [Bacteroidales bacterium]